MNLYVLKDAHGAVRYVGKTVKVLARRLADHLLEARGGLQTHKCRWIRSVGFDVRIELVEALEGDGCAEEIALIASMRASGVALTNLTAGGEGHLNPAPEHRAATVLRNKARVWTPEMRRRASESTRRQMADPIARERIAATLRGGTASKETKAKLSAALKRRVRTPETSRKISATLTGRKLSAEHVAKMSNARLGVRASVEARAKQSAAQTGKKRAPFTETHISNMKTARRTARFFKMSKGEISSWWQSEGRV